MSSQSAGDHKYTNRLIHEKSPYLLQHAHNPVDWYPWGEDAFEKAKKENKIILLSIGYSTCHWCHVMERESFENEATAKILNDNFVCIKVDREERPDVDQIYMNAVMLLTGQGGWPLNLFLTPDLHPFFGGTYFPPDARYGRPGFPTILEDVARTWKNKPEEVLKGGNQLASYIANAQADHSGGTLNEKVLEQASNYAVHSLDKKDGGFRGAPKFPPAMLLSLLMRNYLYKPQPALLEAIELTLDKMYQGGIYDQIGGGFARYSTDDEWLVPHFEKMLYDNALLSRAYVEAYQLTERSEYARIVRETFDYVLRDMTSPEGGFYSAEDADSEGHEGKFYVWTPEEIKAVLGEDNGHLYCQVYNVTEHGNFEDGKSILHLKSALQYPILALGRTPDWWEMVQSKMLAARAKRIRPHLDDKILTAWNSLMISSMALGYQALGDEKYLQAAEKASDFIAKNLFKDGRLLASYRQGASDIQGYIDDYAFYQAAQLDLYESTFNLAYLNKAIELQEDMDRLFWDEKSGAYYFNGSDQKDQSRLLARTKEAYDGVIPSGNSVAAESLYRLAELTGDKKYRDRADAILKCFSGDLAKSGSNFPRMLQAFQFDFRGAAEVFVTGPKAEAMKSLRTLWKQFLPNKVLVYSEEKDIPGLSKTIPWVESRTAQSGKTTFYVCQNYQCQLPTTDEKKALELLKVTPK